MFKYEYSCPLCDGDGRLSSGDCPDCGGSGIIRSNKPNPDTCTNVEWEALNRIAAEKHREKLCVS